MASMLKKAWKRLPTGVRARVHRSLQALLGALTPALVASVWRRGRPAAAPVVVAGLYRSTIGVGQGARLFTAALMEAGLAPHRLDVGPQVQVASDLPPSTPVLPPPPGGVLITQMNPPELERWLQRTGGRALRGRRHIGYWAWELPVAPPSWRRAFGYVDEVWCPSDFTAEALRLAAPSRVVVRTVPHPVFMTPRLGPDRARFGLDAQACVVLSAMDLRSAAARKNPLGVVRAYIGAVPRPDGRSLLLCKLSGAAAAPETLAQMQAEIGGRSDIVLMHDRLDGESMTRLIASADIVVCLHRAEGFGLLAAEAMWLGKPVVATAWSGVMDFMDEESAALAPWTAIPIVDPQGLYRQGWWAEPDLAVAAAHLARLLQDPAERAALGARARRKAEAVFDRQAWTQRVAGLLQGRQA